MKIKLKSRVARDKIKNIRLSWRTNIVRLS